MYAFVHDIDLKKTHLCLVSDLATTGHFSNQVSFDIKLMQYIHMAHSLGLVQLIYITKMKVLAHALHTVFTSLFHR